MSKSPSALRSIIAAAFLSGIAAAPLSAQAEDNAGSKTQRDKNTLTLAPQGEWKLRARQDTCRASRVFGEGENQATLWIDQGGKEPNYNLTLIGSPLRSSYGRAVRIQFGEEKESLRSYVRAKSSKGRPVLTMFGVAIVPPEIERKTDAEIEELSTQRINAIQSFRIAESIVDPLEFELGSMAEPLNFLRGCSEQLSITLNRALSSKSGKAQPPELLNGSNMARLIRYPTYLVSARMEGKVEFRLTINAKGKPTNCNIRTSNRPQLFDDAVCLGLMKHGKFNAALDADGEPAASYYWSSVTFDIR